MPAEAHDELEHKIAKLEAYLDSDHDKMTPQVIATTELEISRLKNLKGDEGVNPQSDIDFPESTIFSATPVNTPYHKGVEKQIISGGKDITGLEEGWDEPAEPEEPEEDPESGG